MLNVLGSPPMRSRTTLVAIVLAAASCRSEQPQSQPQRLRVVEATIAGLQEAITSGKATCRDVVQAHLDRIQAYDETTGLGAITVVNPRALDRADEIDRALTSGDEVGPLFCAPLLVKDNFDTHDLPTTGGSIALEGSLPPDDAFMVRKLREADAIVIAKTNMAEWAFSPRQTVSSSYGTTANAYALDRVPAGSSGGTASGVAASLGVGGLGSDTGNSIRGPSSHLALFGIRSTIGLTSRDGVIPLSFDRDIAGPMTRTVEDGARIFDVVAGYDPADPYTEAGRDARKEDYTSFLNADGLEGARLGVLRRLVDAEDIDPEVEALFEQALEDLRAAGAEIVDPVRVPDMETHLDEDDHYCQRFRYDMHVYLQSLGDDPPLIDVAEAYAAGQYSEYVEKRLSRLAEGPVDVHPKDWDPPCPDFADHPTRQAYLRDVTAAMDDADVDGLLYPTWTHPPAHLDRAIEEYRGDNSQRVAPATGLPAVTVPMGYTYGSLPAGLQILGRAFSEGRLIELAYAYEQATHHRRPPEGFPELLSPASTRAGRRAPSPSTAAGVDWPVYLGDKAATHYSTLDQINRDNVSELEVAWTFDTGDEGEFQSNGLIIDGVLYTAAPSRKVFALNAATGEKKWVFDPASVRSGLPGRRQRGVVYWADGDDRRILTGAGTHLYALDAENGELVEGFGENGSIHLGQGVDTYGQPGPPRVVINTPGVIYQDLYIVGGLTSGPGTIRAYDVRSGEMRWIFYTIPRPGEPGHDTWPPDAYKTTGGASNWSGLALDEERGIVYAPTETAEPDFWGGDRHGANLFANTLVALDAGTGRRLWHHQLVHHDLLDKDLPTPPVLLTVQHEGVRIDAVAQGTKNGLLFVFDRVTGEPLWPIQEVAVPQTNLPGEQTWPTQPVPAKPPPLMRQIYTADDVSNVSPQAHETTSLRYQQVGSFGAFPAPSLDETIIFPGFDGGMEWGGAAADPEGIYYANINEIPWIYQMVPTRNDDGTRVSMGRRTYTIHCSYCHGPDLEAPPGTDFPSLVDLAERQNDAEVAQVVEQGKGRMPPFEHLREGQRRAVVDYLLGREKPASEYEERRHGLRPPRRHDPPYVFAGFRRWLDDEGYPAIKPPWGTLCAVDLNTGEIKWQVPLGEYPELTARGLPPTGTENYGGPVVTASGLVFIGATADETFRAFDKDDGRILWQASLPFSGNATPSTYMIDGRQYVVISAGGGKTGRPAGGRIVAFALPD